MEVRAKPVRGGGKRHEGRTGEQQGKIEEREYGQHDKGGQGEETGDR